MFGQVLCLAGMIVVAVGIWAAVDRRTMPMEDRNILGAGAEQAVYTRRIDVVADGPKDGWFRTRVLRAQG